MRKSLRRDVEEEESYSMMEACAFGGAAPQLKRMVRYKLKNYDQL